MRYRFGRKDAYGRYEHFTVDAPSLKRAVAMFRVGMLYPHNYSTDPIWLSDEEAGASLTSSTEPVALASKPGAVVQVWEHGKNDVPVAEISPEAADAEYVPGMLEDAGLPADQVSAETALAPAGATTGLALGNSRRIDMANHQLDLRRKMAELQRQKHELEQIARALQTELKRRMEQVWFIELFLGSKEEVVRLAEGAPAPADTRITVHQRVLCMDEETAVFDLEEFPERIGGFDCTDVRDFDRWVVEPQHLAAILPEPKGIVALRVRRETKVREASNIGQAYINAQLAEADTCTYLLVRNGENLYRLWVDVVLWPRLVPRVEDMEKRRDRESFGDANDREARAKHYAAGMLVINGLLQRSELLYPLPRVDLNVFRSQDVDEHFRVVHDDDGQNLLGDGRAFEHLSWETYWQWLRNRLGVGVRVIWTGSPTYSKDSEDKLYHRTGIKSVSAWPNGSRRLRLDEAEVYTLTEHVEKSWLGAHWRFLYLPHDDVVQGGSWGRGELVERTRRVSFMAYTDELVPIDFLSWRVLDHLIRDRGQREHYARYFRTVCYYRALAKREADRERPFIDLVLVQCGVELADDQQRARAERLLRWWKLKVHEHRTLGTDEAKALRMITAAFKRGDDEQADPETLLTGETQR